MYFAKDDMGVDTDVQQLRHLHLVDDILFIIPSICQAKRILTEFENACGDAILI